MGDNSSTVFDQYATSSEPIAHEAAQSAKDAYHAFITVPRPQLRVRIYFTADTGELVTYAHIMNVVFTSHTFVTILCTNYAIHIEGQRLSALVDGLQEDRIRTIQCFDARKFEPPEVSEPIIHRIERMRMPDVVQEFANDR